MDRIDLHTHTTASDGTYTPAELVKRAARCGLRAVAVTDHDTVEGVPEALDAGRRTGLEVVPGVEIGVEIGQGSMHLLGYFVDPAHPSLQRRLATLQQARAGRNPRILAKLRDLGMDITMEEVERCGGHGQIGRAHIAATLKAKGYVGSIQEAFDRFLKEGRPAYQDKYRFDPETAFAMIHEAGGLSSLAHPFTITRDEKEIERWIRRFKSLGLDAVEAYYPDHTPEQTRHYRNLADKYELLVTGGSDFHGAHKPDIRLGTGRGGLYVPYSLLQKMKERLSELRGRKED